MGDMVASWWSRREYEAKYIREVSNDFYCVSGSSRRSRGKKIRNESWNFPSTARNARTDLTFHSPASRLRYTARLEQVIKGCVSSLSTRQTTTFHQFKRGWPVLDIICSLSMLGGPANLRLVFGRFLRIIRFAISCHRRWLNVLSLKKTSNIPTSNSLRSTMGLNYLDPQSNILASIRKIDQSYLHCLVRHGWQKFFSHLLVHLFFVVL